jgi:hypothetical protein
MNAVRSKLGRLISLWAVGQDSVVGIASRYKLEGIKTQRGQYFLHLSRPALGPTQLPVQWVLGPFPKGNAAGAWL